MTICNINDQIKAGAGEKLLFIAGPCQIESLDLCLRVAEHLKKLAEKFPISLVFKASFDKANRTSISGERGLGLELGLSILKKIKDEFDVPILSDIHLPEQAAPAAEVLDIIQLPAFLCRQTDLLAAAGETGKALNIKKGQFLHPEDMAHCAAKAASTGNNNIMLCERGSCFGYRELIVDMRSLVMMRKTGYPVIFDATHSVQVMGGAGGSSGGAREYIFPLSRAAAAVGIDGLFVECHPEPEKGLSDKLSMLPLDEVSQLLEQVCRIRS